jgi:hypothetical protein
MGHGAGVPPFGEHRNREYAAHLLAEPAWLPDGIHDLAQQVFIRDLFGGALSGTLSQRGFERIDFGARKAAELRRQRVA